ncbi:beta-galactosidase [Phytoactinopolyspora alkaliphila]|uniref:Beta-galactosidase n=1 Tax=Phytoactinopolyspora alkaliphila TaxID=1783498 RepID=A0A6N9YT41_9ACTN|nr:beta-galactosidase [Phytoactinopolyspora alkaliphila]NED98206.1 beta-galactosidase [Phytoactinopolyspora alkaliphila]
MNHQPASHRWLRWPTGTSGRRLAYGADYNPEQWPREVWDEDVRLMREAGVNIVSLAIFSWARIQPDEDSWDFGWLDEVIDLLHANGVAVDLATATASPPPWLTAKHPEVLPVTLAGEVVWPGARQHWRPTSRVFREYALRLVRRLAERYGHHPALAAWHVSNELGCHNVYDYSDDAAHAFRGWLQDRYGDLDALNHAWGTAFWSQRYSDWEQILPPRLAASHPNPTQHLDFKRFSSNALKEYLRAESEVLRELTPDLPVTTNFMVMGQTKGMDYADWASEVDFVSNDHYVLPGPQAFDELSFSANLTGNLAGGRPWFLMEHSTSAVNWQPVNLAKKPGELARDSLTHVAHGADAVCFFQWRQSAAGAEKYHSAMVPHAGPESDVFRGVVELGATLESLAPVTGSVRKPAPVAILMDWDSWWASEQDAHPNSELRYHQEALDWYSALLATGVRADVVPVASDWSSYQLVVAPILHVVPAELAARLTRYVDDGGHLVTTYFSGIVDENDHAWLGGYPGALRELLGIRVEEFAPLLSGQAVQLDNGTTGTLWTERVDVVDPAVKVIAGYISGEQSGRPAITRRAARDGSAAYVSTRLGAQGLAEILGELLTAAGIGSELPLQARGQVELAIRSGPDEEFWFLINRTSEHAEIPNLAGRLVAGSATHTDGTLALHPRGVAVLRR